MRKTIVYFALVAAIFTLVNEISAQTRIRFARGRTSATVSGTLAAGYGKTYVLGARQGQVFSGNISSRGDCVIFTQGATSTSFITERGDNLVRIRNNCRGSVSFTMTVSINFGSD